MSNENYEVMEQDVTTEVTEMYDEYDAETKSKSGFGVTALVVGGGLALVGLAAAGIKKLKNKNADGSKKQKTKWKFVKVPVESEAEDYYEESETDYEAEEE